MSRSMKAVSILVTVFVVATSIGISVCNGNGNSHVGCIEREREALLRFKQDLIDPSNRLASWSEINEDCCKWVGISCDHLTGHVLGIRVSNPHAQHYDEDYEAYEAYEKYQLSGKVGPSLLNLTHLSSLDLSHNNFSGLRIPDFFGSLSSLRYLNLSNAQFGGMIPHQLGNISNLSYLDLNIKIRFIYSYMYAENLQWLSLLLSLKHLDMGNVDLGKASDWLQVTNTLPSLEELHLSGCNLQNMHLPNKINFSSLSKLDLSRNFMGSNLLFPSYSWLFGLNNLVFLDLSFNAFQDPIPSGLQNITSLKHLDLSYNYFNSSALKWLNDFRSLEFLSIRSNDLQGSISNVIDNLTSAIGTLDLSFNFLSGQLTDRLGEFEKLTHLDLSNNLIFGTIPGSIGKLMHLEVLHLSENNLTGVVSEEHFANLTKLHEVIAFGNLIHMKASPFWIPPFQAFRLEFGSWNLGPRFPQWLRSQKSLSVLDISNTKIADTIPNWFWNMSSQFGYLDLSHNQIYGKLPNNFGALQDFAEIFLNSNHFEGPLPPIFSKVDVLDISNNWLSGSIFSFLCYHLDEPKSMIWLNLERNDLSGKLPNCWMGWPNLETINLNENNFTGSIPFSLGNMNYLKSLHLRNNKLSGLFPRFLSNCTELGIIDISENELVGSIPSWIGEKLSNLVILSLRSNKLEGHIPNNLCSLSFLQILDLANNNVSGTIPRCVNNFTAMTREYDKVFDYMRLIYRRHSIESEMVKNKGIWMSYSTNLGYVRVLDLSNNRLFGEVPPEVTSLKGLQSLNLSDNLLTGRIPKNIAAMKSLESLDLSINQLSGEIPQGMSDLTFLAVLNLSYNHLRGKIPSSTQLQSFDASSFIGNQLSGPPLDNSTNGVVPTVESGRAKAKKELQIDWFYMSMALGFVVGFWGAVASLFFCRPWRIVFFEFVDRIWLLFLLFLNRVFFLK